MHNTRTPVRIKLMLRLSFNSLPHQTGSPAADDAHSPGYGCMSSVCGS